MGIDQGLQLKSQVVEELGVAAAVGALVVALDGRVTDAFDQKDVEPGAHPDPQAHPQGSLAKGLCGGLGVGHRLVKAAAGLGGGGVGQQVGVELEGKGTAIDQAAVEPQAGEVFGSPASLEIEGFAEIGIDHLTAPGGHGPVVGMPIGHRRQHRRAAHRLRGWERCRRRLIQQKVAIAAVEVENSVDVLSFTASLQQAVAQLAGLQVLLAALEPHTSPGEDRAAAGLEFQPVGEQAAPRQAGLHVANGDHPTEDAVVAQFVGAELELKRQCIGRHGIGRHGIRCTCTGCRGIQGSRIGARSLNRGKGLGRVTGLVLGRGLQLKCQCGGHQCRLRPQHHRAQACGKQSRSEGSERNHSAARGHKTGRSCHATAVGSGIQRGRRSVQGIIPRGLCGSGSGWDRWPESRTQRSR